MHGSSTTIALAYPQIFLSNSQLCSAQRFLRTGHTYAHNGAKLYNPREMGQDDQDITQSCTALVSETARFSSPTVSTLPFPLEIEAQLTL